MLLTYFGLASLFVLLDQVIDNDAMYFTAVALLTVSLAPW